MLFESLRRCFVLSLTDLIVVLILAQCTEIYSMDAFISLKLLSSWLAENWGYSQLKQLEFQLQKHKQSFEK